MVARRSRTLGGKDEYTPARGIFASKCGINTCGVDNRPRMVRTPVLARRKRGPCSRVAKEAIHQEVTTYCLGAISKEGYIWAELPPRPNMVVLRGPGRIMVHKESIFPDKLDGIGYDTKRVELIETLDQAKERLNPQANPDDISVILQVQEGGGCETVWAYDDSIENVIGRLKRWRGCYGGFKLRKLTRKDKGGSQPVSLGR